MNGFREKCVTHGRTDERTNERTNGTEFIGPCRRSRGSKKTKSTKIPPILFDNVFITDIQEKAIMFNDYFSQQCTPLDGDPLPIFKLKTSMVLSEVPFNESDIQSILKSLNPNKSHG